MPNSVDTRVVEMKFDNSNFEKNMRQSMKTLDDFDKALDFDNKGKGFKRLEKDLNSLDVSKLENTLDQINHRFSTMGIVGATVVSELTKSFIGLGKTLYNSTIGQIKSGGMSRALNIESAKFQLEGLGVAWDEIEKDINYGVKDTAYGLDAAAKAAAQLTASGITMGEEMQKALRGISGVAAMTNASYEEISPIFTTIAGQGQVMTMQLRQLEARGLNAAATLAKALNTTEAEIREMVKHGEIDFKTFAHAMDDAFGDHAKDANKTFTGALSNMKAALSRIGADFATPYMDNMRAIFVATTKVIDGIRKQLKPFIKMVSDSMYQIRLSVLSILRSSDLVKTYTGLFHGLGEVLRLITSLLNPIAIAFRNVFPEGLLGLLAKVATGFDNVASKASFSRPVITAVIEVFEALFSVLKLGLTIIAKLTKVLKPVINFVKPIVEYVIKLTGKLANLVTQITRVITGSDKLTSAGKSIKSVFSVIGDAILDVIDNLTDFVESVAESEKAKEVFDNIGDAITKMSNIALTVLGGAALIIVSAIDGIAQALRNRDITKLFSGFNDRILDLSKTVETGSGFLEDFSRIFSGGFRNIPRTVHAAGKSYGEFNDTVKKATNTRTISGLTKLKDRVNELTSAIDNMIGPVTEGVKSFGVGRGLIVGFSASIIALISQTAGLVKGLKKAFTGIPGLITAITKSFDHLRFEATAKIVITGLAVAIVGLAGALVALSLVDTSKLKVATACLSSLIGVMTVAGILIKKLGGGLDTFKNISFSFISFAGSIYILTSALKQMVSLNMNWGQLWKSLVGLLGIMGLMTGVIIAITKFAKPFSIVMGSGFMLAFALSTKMLVQGLKVIAELDMSKLKAALPSLLEIMGMLALIALASTALSPFAGVGFLGIVAGFLLLVKGCSMLADVDVSLFYHVKFIFEDICKALTGWLKIWTAIAIVVAVTKALKTLSNLIQMIKNPIAGINKGMKELGKAAEIASIGVTFFLIAQGIWKLSTIPMDKFQLAVDTAINICGGMILVATVLTGLSTMLPKDNIFSSIGKVIQGIGVLIAALAISMKLLDGLETPGEALILMGGMLVVLYAFIKLLGTLQQANPMIAMGIKTAVAMGLVLSALTLSLSLLSMVASADKGAMIGSGLMLGLVVAALAAVCYGLGSIQKTGPAITAAIGLGVMLGALAATFYVMKDMNAAKAWGEGILLLSVITILSIIAYALSKLDTVSIAAATLSLIGLAAAFAIFAGVFKVLESINYEKLVPALNAMMGVVIALSVIIGVLGVIGAATEGIFTVALLGAAAAMLEFAVAMIGFAAAGVIFAGAAYIFAAACDRMADALTKFQDVNFLNIAQGLAVIAASGLGLLKLIGLGVTIMLLGALGLVLSYLNPILATNTAVMTGFSIAIAGLGDAFAHFGKCDFTGVAGNLLAIGTALVGITVLAPDIIAVTKLMKDLAKAIGDIDEFTTSLSGNLDSLRIYTDNLVEATELLNKVFEDLPDAIDKASERLRDNAMTVFISQMADAMRLASTVEMPSCGVKVVEDFREGFEMVADTESEALIRYFVAGLTRGVDMSESELKGLGEHIGSLITEEGVESQMKINSPSKKAVWEMLMFVAGLKKGADVSEQTLKEIGEFCGTTITNETLTSLENGETDVMTVFGGMLDKVQGLANDYGITIPIGLKITTEDSVDLRTISGYDPSKANIPGYNDFYKGKTLDEVKNFDYETVRDQALALKKATEGLGGSVDASSGATDKESKSSKKNSKEKKENTKKKKENTKATKDNTDAIRALEEEIEKINIVTAKYNENLNWSGYKDNLKVLKSLTKAFGQFWSSDLSSTSKIDSAFDSVAKSLKKTTDVVPKGTYYFSESGKQLAKYSKTAQLTAKVSEGQMKVFLKNQNGIEKMTFAIPKYTKNIAKYVKQAKAFANSMNNVNVNKLDTAESFITSLRNTEKYFTTFKTMPKQLKAFTTSIYENMSEVNDAMDTLGKNIDGVYGIMNKKSKSTAYVEDAFIALAASLYDGSDAANEYATEHEKLVKKMENGLATQEEVAEHTQSYIKRITEALVEYKNTITETLTSGLDVWSEFDKGLIEGGKDTLLRNIESQIAGMQTWSDMLMELSKRGTDSNIIKVLADEGTKSYGKLSALLEMTEGELALFTLRYQQSQKMIETTTNTVLAAVANAQTRANQRAAAEKGNKVAQAQLKNSKKLAKQQLEEIKGVAKAQAEVNTLTAKQEKAYLKTLTKKEQKAYKAAKKEAQAEQKKLKSKAATEAANRAEQDRLATIVASIKSLKDYTSVMYQYANDTSALTAIATKMGKAFEPLSGTMSAISSNTELASEAMMRFAETLDETGDESLNYFEELSARVQNFQNEIKSTITGVNYLTTAFGDVSKIKMADTMSNIYSNILGTTDSTYFINKLTSMGFNSLVLKGVLDTWKSNQAEGNALIESLIGATREEIEEINAAYEYRTQVAEDLAKAATVASSRAASKASLESELKRREQAINVARQHQIDAINEVNAAQQRSDMAIAKRNEALRKADETAAQVQALNKKKKKTAAIQAQIAALTNQQNSYMQQANAYQKEAEAYLYQRAQAEQNLRNAMEEENNAQQRYIDQIMIIEDYEHRMAVARERLIKKANLSRWFTQSIEGAKNWITALSRVKKATDEWAIAQGKVSEMLVDFSGAIAKFNAAENFTNIKSVKDIVNVADLKIVEEGLIAFGQTMSDTWEGATQALQDYQKQLTSTIKQSSDFFSKFSGFSDEDNPMTASKYLDNASSQVEALKKWQEMLIKVTDMGYDKGLIEQFASAGLSSYEKLYAMVNATSSQVGEYNKLWRAYEEQVKKATESAMASIGASWSRAGESLQDSMTKMFDGNSERFKEAGYNASAMVITGMKDGLANAMPTIISAIEKATPEAVAEGVGKTVANSLNAGLTEAVSTSVTETINSAVEKFKMAVDSVKTYIQDNLPSDYTITIHVNTSDIDAAVARMNQAISMTNASAGQTSQAVTTSQNNQRIVTEPVAVTPASSNTTVNLTQNNYSPKALSQVEIYRNTQSQLNQTKNLIELQNMG